MFSMKPFLLGINSYLRDNLGASFVIRYQLFLLVCAGLLILANSVWVEGVVFAAHFSLVIWFVLQVIFSLKPQKEEK